MAKTRRIRFTGTGFQALGWGLYYILLFIPIIPAAWGAAALYRWLTRNLSFDDDTKAFFEGQGGQVWGYFALSMLLGYVPLLFNLAEDTTTISYISIGLSILMLPISAAIGIRIVRWLIANIKFSDGTNLNFKGSYAPYLGWLLLNSLSVFTVIGWAWVSVAFLRWVCRNIEADSNEIEFVGSGWGLLWRSVLAGLASLFIIPIPWIWLWVFRWGIRNIVIRQETNTFQSNKSNKKIYFCFTMEDVSRAVVVKNYWESEANGNSEFTNPIELMNLEKQGVDAVKHRIIEQLEGTNVTVVLVGKETCTDPWVRFAIEKSIEKGNGLLGIDISKIKDLQGNTSEPCGMIPEGYPFYYWNMEDGKTNIIEWIENSGNQPPEEIITDTCPGCGNVVETGWAHCGYCGRKVSEARNLTSQENATPVEGPPLIPIPPNPVKSVEHTKHKTWIWIIGVISIVLIALLLIFVVFRKGTIDNGLIPGLTNPGALAAESSPKIVFDTNRDGNFEIYVMNADGSNPINLTNNQADDGNPVWSPVGQKIAFISNREGVFQIFIMNSNGSNQTRLTNNQVDSGFPTWSPDGQKIAYQCSQDENWEICVMNADGSNQTRLTNNQASEGSPAWSADGKKIAFSSDRGGSWGVYVMKTDGSGQTQLTNNQVNSIFPTWSPDGQKIAYQCMQENWEICVMNADGSNPINLTNYQANEGTPVWSPDGQKILFISTRDGNTEIYTFNADGSNQVRLTINPAEDNYPNWSATGGATVQAYMPTGIPPEVITNAPIDEPVSAEVQALADEYFESGGMVYIYNPQPASVALSALNSTEFSFRYIISKNTKSIPNFVIIWRVNSAGEGEYMIPFRSSIEDWESMTGLLTFSMLSVNRDMYRQQYEHDPNQAVLQGWVGMTPVYGGLNEFYVDDPTVLDVFLMAPEEQDEVLLLTDASTPLSNSVRIQVSP